MLLVYRHQISLVTLLLPCRRSSALAMSNEYNTIHLQQALDAEKGNYEPWSLQTASNKGSLPSTPSSQTLNLKGPPSSVFPQKEHQEIRIEPKPASKAPKKKVSKWVVWRVWFNTYRYESSPIFHLEAGCNGTNFTESSSYSHSALT